MLPKLMKVCEIMVGTRTGPDSTPQPTTLFPVTTPRSGKPVAVQLGAICQFDTQQKSDLCLIQAKTTFLSVSGLDASIDKIDANCITTTAGATACETVVLHVYNTPSAAVYAAERVFNNASPKERSFSVSGSVVQMGDVTDSPTSTAATTTTTTKVATDVGKDNCTYAVSDCTSGCEKAGDRKLTVSLSKQASALGKAVSCPLTGKKTDCKVGEGRCTVLPTTTSASTTTPSPTGGKKKNDAADAAQNSKNGDDDDDDGDNTVVIIVAVLVVVAIAAIVTVFAVVVKNVNGGPKAAQESYVVAFCASRTHTQFYVVRKEKERARESVCA